MTDYPLVQFVSAPEVGATVRYDFNPSRSLYVGAEDFDEGVPEFEGEPGGVGIEPTGRTVSFQHHFMGDRAAMGTAQSTVARELMRSTNWLLYQQSATSERRWIKTYQQTPGRFDRTNDTNGAKTRWSLDLTLAADPFWLGARETLPTVTIHNDPAVPTTAINPPTLNAATTATTGGTLAAGTYYYVVTATTSAGESTISNRVSRVTTGTTSTVGLSWSAVTNAGGYKVYRATTSGQEKLLATLGAVTSYTDTGTAASTTAFPTTNTTAGNPMRYLLPTIKGDAPAPLTVKVDAGSTFTYYPQFLLTVAGQRGVLQSSAMSASTDADASDTASAAYSGGSYRRITFATTTTMTPRVSGSLALPASGRYRVLARVARSDTSTTFDVQGQTTYINGPVVSMNRATTDANANGYATWLDLGEFSYPFGVSNEPLSTGELSRASDDFTLAAARTSGTGQMRVDVIVAIPTDDAVTARYGFLTLWAGSSILDGDTEQIADLDVPGKIMQFVGMSGAFPAVDPSVSGQRLYFFQKVAGYLNPGVASSDDTDLTSLSMNLTLSYAPRYLYLGAS